MKQFSFLIIIILFFLVPTKIDASFMSGDNFKINLDEMSSAGTSKDPDYNLKSGLTDKSTKSTSQVQKKEVEEEVLPPGTVSYSKPLAIHLSTSQIDYGTISPTNPIIRSINISISSSINPGYSVIAFENQPLYAQKINSFIPNTSCDTGACTIKKSDPWASTLVYGFGYRCENKEGKDCASFVQKNSFKSFANQHENEIPQIIMNSGNITSKAQKTNSQAQIDFKVNTSGTQPKGSYYNKITMLAVPNF